MARTVRSRIARAAVVGGLTAAALLGTAGGAFAGPPVGAVLQPGGRVCTPVQFAGHKAVLNANATGGATTVVLYRDGVTIGQVNGAHQTSIGFSAPWLQPGNYQGCSTNTSGTQTVAQLQLFVDKEVR